MKIQKLRLDVLLLDRGLAQSRSKAQALVMAGEVLIAGERALKPGMLISSDVDIELVAPLPYVSRGGYKLAAALKTFDLSVLGKVCADVGACTGGFTDVLLQHDASRVYAIDVGYGQLDWRLRNDERVVIIERTNARYLEFLPEVIDFVSIDVSFISLRLILPVVRNWMRPGGEIVTLIKPQFEAGRNQVGKGGVVRDPAIHLRVLEELLEWAKQHKFYLQGLIRSPIKGSSGNIEFLAWLNADADSRLDLQTAIDKVINTFSD